jgi:hypothetical protein
MIDQMLALSLRHTSDYQIRIDKVAYSGLHVGVFLFIKRNAGFEANPGWE